MAKTPVFFIALLLTTPVISFSQKVTGRLKFEQGRTLEIQLQLKTTISQEAMGQAIDFTVDGTGIHTYQVTNATDDNNTLHHQPKHIAFTFDGMGQKRSFDSDNEKDMNGQFGKPIKEVLAKKFDMIIDTAGKVLMVAPEKVDTAKMDDRLAIITNMLKDVLDVVQPPQKGSASFFKVLPETETGKGDKWADTLVNGSIKSITTYTLTDINDSTIIINLVGNSVTVTKAQMMGNETTTSMNNKTTGAITVDRLSGIVREKKITTESNGTTESTFGSLPVTSKKTILITVK